MKYELEKNFIIEVAKKAYEKFSKEDLTIEQKGDFDLVTTLDKNIEKYITEEINKKFPTDKILGEEFNSTCEISGRVWTIDPIDGTVNMANGINIFGMQCALIDNNEIVLGVIYLPNLDEVYYAVKGEGAYFNNNRFYTNNNVLAKDAIIAIGDIPHDDERYAKRELKAIEYMYDKVAKLRIVGAACYFFSFAAISRFNATVLMTLNVWDIAPGLIICKEAGMKVTNADGKEYHFGDRGVIAAANDEIFDLLLKAYNL